MSANIVIVDGVATNEDLGVKSPLIRVAGSGKANLPADTIDYLVQAELVTACEGQSGASANQLVGVPLPIRVQGSMSAPKISPDWGALGKELAQSKIQETATALIKVKLNIPGLGSNVETTGEPAKDLDGALKKGSEKPFLSTRFNLADN